MMVTEFKAGDKVRRVSYGLKYAPIGHLSIITTDGTTLLYTDNEGDEAAFFPDHWELVEEPATPTFDATKLRKGDKVLAIVEVRVDGVDRDGEVDISSIDYLKPAKIVGYAPGYTPKTPQPTITPEQAMAYALAHEEDVRAFIKANGR